MEAVLVIISITYLVGIFRFERIAISHLAAWTIFLAWMELILLMGRHPKVAIYVHMFTTVFKVLLKCILMYSPGLIAFALSFYLLMPHNKTFPDPLQSLLKIFVMMVGELEYVDNFTWKSSSDNSSYGSNQIFFLIFLIAISIIIVNLLVGLTIGEVGVLRTRARAIRLKKMAVEIIRMEDFYSFKEGNAKRTCNCLLRLLQGELNLFSFLKNKSNMIYTGKVCVKPSQQRKKGYWFPSLSIQSNSEHINVYIYNEAERSAYEDERIGTLPYSVVVKTQETLDQKEEARLADEEKQEEAFDNLKMSNEKYNKTSNIAGSLPEYGDYIQRNQIIGLNNIEYLEKMERKIDHILACLKRPLEVNRMHSIEELIKASNNILLPKESDK